MLAETAPMRDSQDGKIEPPAAPTASTSAAALQRTASKALRTKRYRYVLEDLPPPPPPPSTALPLPPNPPTARAPEPRAELGQDGNALSPDPLSALSATSSPGDPLSEKPSRPARSKSRPPPPPPLIIPDSAFDAFDSKLPKALRRRSRSIGPTATAAPFVRGHRRHAPNQHAVEAPPPHSLIHEEQSRDESQTAEQSPPAQDAQYELPLSREESLRTLRRMSRSIAKLGMRPLPRPPVASDGGATTSAALSTVRNPTSSVAATAASASTVLLPEVQQETANVAKFPSLRGGIKRVSRSFTNLRTMYALDSLQTEDRASRALDDVTRKRADAETDRVSRSRRPQHERQDSSNRNKDGSTSSPPNDGSSVQSRAISQRGDAFAKSSPSPPLSPPSASRRDSNVSATSGARGSRVLSSAAMYRMRAMSSALPASNLSRPASRVANFPTLSVNRPQPTAFKSNSDSSVLTVTKPAVSAYNRPLHPSSSTASLANTNMVTSSTSPEKERKRRVVERVAPATMRTPDMQVVVSSPVDPVAGPGNRISFLQHKMKKPYMGERF
ncbi:hypothetical protein BKA62DRAFT_686564 [Auriculariales sp. MPI-PUGE-AT-0066]|nr:hypothetical protein BKA62DRAFT_686564 [Auriculariales sp. MPI-PUGE-AT-0066]